MSSIKHVTAENFQGEVLNSEIPVLIDFYATWCAPCRMMGPILEKVAQQVAGRAKVLKIDVDEAPELAAQFRVSSIPTLVVMQQGTVLASMVGVKPAESLIALLNNISATAATTAMAD